MDAISLIGAAGALTLALLAAAHLLQSEALQRALAYAALSGTALTSALMLELAANTQHGKGILAPATGIPAMERDCPLCPAVTVVVGGDVVLRDSDGGAKTQRIWPGFLVSRKEISAHEYADFVEATGRDRQPCAPTAHDRAVCVRRNDAEAYADWLSRMSGRRYRLITAVEWAHAAKISGGTSRQIALTGMHDGIAEIVDDCEGACASALDRRYNVTDSRPDGRVGFRVARSFDLAL